MNKLPLPIYLAVNAPQNALKILTAWGVPVQSNHPRELAAKLTMLFQENPEAVLEDMANLHPDKDIILAVENKKSVLANGGDDEQHSNCACNSFAGGSCGCSCGGACKKNGFSNFGGPVQFVNDKPASEGLYPVVLFGSIIAALGFMLTKSN